VSVRGRLRRLALLCGTTACLSCSASDQSKAKPEEEPEDQILNVAQNFNVCPRFEGSIVLPQTIAPGQEAVIVVRAVDPDGDDRALSYGWSVTSGELSETVGGSTKYLCDELGPQIVSIVTTDAPGCHVQLDIAVNCLER
jgi:hypothetical protein